MSAFGSSPVMARSFEVPRATEIFLSGLSSSAHVDIVLLIGTMMPTA